jgi:hypothetical protein
MQKKTCGFPRKIYVTDDKLQNFLVPRDFTKSNQKYISWNCTQKRSSCLMDADRQDEALIVPTLKV